MKPYIFILNSSFFINCIILTYVFAQRKNKNINLKNAFILYIVMLQIWLISQRLLMDLSSEFLIVLALKVKAMSWITSGMVFLNFTKKIIKKNKNIVYNILLIICIMINTLNICTNLIIKGYEKYTWGVADSPGKVYLITVFYAAITFLYSFYLILNSIKQSQKENFKNQLIFLFTGTFMSMILAISIDVILPIVFHKKDFYRLSSCVSTFQLIIIFISIKKYSFLSVGIEDIYSDLINGINEGVILLNELGSIIEINNVAKKILGIKTENINELNIKSYIDNYQYNNHYIKYKTNIFNGLENRVVLISQSIIKKSKYELGKILIINDITDYMKEKSEKEYFKNLSIVDSLTGLYNHRYLKYYIKEILNNEINETGVLFCDIDYFKKINDKHGHNEGDNILKQTGDIIKDIVKGKGCVFRYGGEEFVILLTDQHSKEYFKIAEKIREEVLLKVKINNCPQHLVSISLGIARYPVDSDSIEDVISKADKAMYYSKINGRNQSSVYSSAVDNIINVNDKLHNRNEILIDSVYALTAAIDAKDSYTGRHSEMVAKYSLLLAKKLDFTEEEHQKLKIGALLHDIGKIGIPDNIINKPGRLNEEEYNIIKNHSLLGSTIVSYMIKDLDIKSCIRNHHESWNGTGYPDGLENKEINLFARIVCIADSYHAMTSERSYRKALTQEEALKELRKSSGSQFDPELVNIFIEAINKIS